MARNPFPINSGANYLTRRPSAKGPRKSADVLKTGNGLVVFRVVHDDEPTQEIKVMTEANFRRAYTDEDMENLLYGAKIAKKSIINRAPEAANAW